MDKHPIENIMTTTMENIRDMVDVDTVIGEAIVSPDGTTVIPLSRVCFGFVAGGGEYKIRGNGQSAANEPLPFAGGTGAGVTIHPMGFLVMQKDSVRLLPAQHYEPADRIIELVPQVMTEVKNVLAAWAKKKQQEVDEGACKCHSENEQPMPEASPDDSKEG